MAPAQETHSSNTSFVSIGDVEKSAAEMARPQSASPSPDLSMLSVETSSSATLDELCPPYANLSTLHRLAAHIGAALTLFLATTDATIVSTSLPTIAGELHMSQSQYTWVGIAYLLTQTSFQPLYGSLSDLAGRKARFFICMFIFVIGSMVCGAAQSIAMLLAGRAIAGIGAGGIVGSVWVITAEIVEEDNRPKCLLFMAGSSFIVVGFNLASANGWTSPLTLLLICLGFLLLVVGGIHETFTKRVNLFPALIFSNHRAVAVLAITFFHNVAFTAGTFFLGLYYQAANGSTPLEAGFKLLPYSLGSSLASMPAAWINSKGPTATNWVVSAGLLISTLGFGLLNLLDERSSVTAEIFPLVSGIGIGMLFHSPFSVFTRIVGRKDIAAATSAFFLVRFTGATTGLAIAGAIFDARALTRIPAELLINGGSSIDFARLGTVEPPELKLHVLHIIATSIQTPRSSLLRVCGTRPSDSRQGEIVVLRLQLGDPALLTDKQTKLTSVWQYKQPTFTASLLQCLRALKVPTWSTPDIRPQDLRIVKSSSSLTNAVFFVSSSCPGPRTVLLRIYGPNSGALISRVQELHTLHTLSSDYHIGPRVFGTFENGRIEEYFDSTTLTAADLRDPKISRWIGARMAELHSVDIEAVEETSPDTRGEGKGWEIGVKKNMKSWIQPAREVLALPGTSDALREAIDFDAFLGKWERYWQWLASVDNVDKGSRRVFAHNDTQYGNLLLLSKRNESLPEHRQIIVVDFEYASPNPASFDIANHFHEWTANYHSETPHLLDPAIYPTQKERYNFYVAYLEYATVSPAERPSALSAAELQLRLEDLDAQVHAWSPASHAWWAVWGIVQAREDIENHVQSPEFDYLAYAQTRFAGFERELQALGI
ncbi:hypothetical protein MKEN_00785700 [Mycena kentingensis (nom. inval.)]|nr:hypothetical protein MKEN_00785700 [Mycena kentingensis (nom. inval.)]